MKKEEFRKLTTELATNLDKPEKVTEILTKINEVYDTVSTTSETLSEKVNGYDTRIKELQEKNMDLFLKIGNPVDQKKLNSTEPLTYEALFDEKGGLK